MFVHFHYILVFTDSEVLSMLHEISFHSFNDRDEVQGWVYVPACKPKGIVQVIHGFGEHSRRYFHMIVKFMDAGYIVAADDHVGHGKTAMYNNTWGDWGDAGFHTMMEDEHKLKEIVNEMYPDLPYFLFGMGLCTCLQTKRNCTGNPWIRRTFSPLFPYDREIYGCWVYRCGR